MSRSQGIRKRHSKSCRARAGGRCNCDQGWEAEVWSSRDGKKIRKTFATEAAARGWRADALAMASKGALRAPTPTTVSDAAKALFDGMRDGTVRNRSGKPYKPSAIASYEDGFKRHLERDFGGLRLADLTVEMVQRKVERMLADDYSASTIRNTLMPLRVVYRRACRPGGELLPAANPTRGLELPALEGGRDRIASPQEAEKLIGLLPRMFDRALWAVAFYAGLRLGELLALRWHDVDLAAGVIQVRQAYDPDARAFIAPKSAAGVRKVPIAAVLRDYLLAWKLESGGEGGVLVFGRDRSMPFDSSSTVARARRAWAAVDAVTCRGVTRSGEPCRIRLTSGEAYCPLHRDQAAAGEKVDIVRTVEPILLHEARHTFASLMIAAGVNAKALSIFMGHSSIAITFDLYGHLMPGGEEEAAALLDAYLERANTQARLAQIEQPDAGETAVDAGAVEVEP